MKTVFRFYAVIWAILFVAFLFISILSPGWIGIEKLTPSFWTGFAFIMISFVLQLGCALKAFATDDIQKFFYNIPLIRISYAGLIATFICGGLCMFLSLLWGWVAAIICIIVLAVTIIALLKGGAAGELVGEIDDEIKEETYFVKLYTIKAAELETFAKTEIAKAEAKKIADSFRYSDPMSKPELEAVEAKIELAFEKFENAVKLGSEEVLTFSEELESLIKARNNECKLLK